MSLKEINLKFKYRSDKDQIHRDFYQKCIEQAKYYDRAAGYFTSGSLQLMAKGLEKFIEGDGKIRMIANPYLNDEDIKAIELGHKAKNDVVLQSFLREIKITEETIIDETLNILAWLIWEEKLELKIAFSTNSNQLYHEKFGIFTDTLGNHVAFSGSANETIGGMKNNFEKIDVFYKEEESIRVQDMIDDFERLWENNTEGLEIIDLPQAVAQQILSNKKETKPTVQYITNDLSLTNDAEQSDTKIVLARAYQVEAMEAFKNNDWKGILEMATGTGKTITSLLIARDFKEQYGRVFLVILVPFVHLVDQWEQSCNTLGFEQVLSCTGSRSNWEDTLSQKVRDFNIGISTVEVLITTYRSACSKTFNDKVSEIRGRAFLIADECHYFGIPGLRDHQLHKVQARLGLSATPDRWWDEKGTKELREYFSDTVYEYDMEKAIANNVLTEYEYTPYVVDLDPDENEKYSKLTKRLIYLLQNKGDKDEIKRINLARSTVVSKARNKKLLLYKLFDAQNIQKVSHTLVYCAKGEVEEITKELANKGLRVHRFDSKIDMKTRKTVLEAFARGHIQVLVAIKCLDEGVDVPSTKTAYFLASTSNPREFVQRRGRILRQSKGKSIAYIHDFIVLPKDLPEQLFRSVASKELPRFAEFSKYAINSFSCKKEVRKILENYGLEYLMEQLPWDVYREMKKQWEDQDEY